MGLLKSSEYTFTNYHIMSCGFIMLYVKGMFQIVVSLHCFWTLQVLWLIVKAEIEEENNCTNFLWDFNSRSLHSVCLWDQNSIRLKTMYGAEYKSLAVSGNYLYFIGFNSKG